ncbi:ribonuclease Y [Planomonospora sp. ID67723]|uniref:ribonuclease Y n=1 Tax=Planomonospora sp. ID67723 TaxID=2738134 RepID=UPI0018C44E1A|nr:ribonuclease Y [Planomonospora sp. ID67723]MBG0828857.1 ribonuclease Y [Planomonospora sp. ID67723]
MEPVVVIVLAGAMVVLAGVTITALVVLLRRTGGMTGTPIGPSSEQLAEIQGELEEARREAVEIRARAEQEAGELFRRSEQQAAEARRRSEQEAEAILRRSEAAAESAAQLRKEVEAESQVLKYELKELRSDLERRENRLAEREQRLDEEARRQAERARKLAETETELADRREALDRLAQERRTVLERVAGLTSGQAKSELVREIENQAKREAALIVREIESEARKEGEKRATKIVTLAVQRVAAEQTAESVVSVLHLPGDEMKGRIIGREGRNIRAFESTTGVNLIIDDTPEAVLLSCFDPVRRETARLTLEKLVLDGRIHPQRIEDAYERSRAEVQELCVRAGEDALVELGITEMHPELITLLGQLRYRTSYGQNVLGHLVESAHIAGIMAAELRLDQMLLKRCTLLHDIGKALTHEVEGSHALIGAEIARRYGEHEDVVHAIEAHHNEVEVRTVEAVLTQAADAISGGRPGARRESLEAYVKRLERLEEIAQSYTGVEKVFAMQAGREIRVMVKPDSVDDIQASVIARDVAKQVEEELTYPGQIRITVVRESRATEFAR